MPADLGISGCYSSILEWVDFLVNNLQAEAPIENAEQNCLDWKPFWIAPHTLSCFVRMQAKNNVRLYRANDPRHNFASFAFPEVLSAKHPPQFVELSICPYNSLPLTDLKLKFLSEVVFAHELNTISFSFLKHNNCKRQKTRIKIYRKMCKKLLRIPAHQARFFHTEYSTQNHTQENQKTVAQENSKGKKKKKLRNSKNSMIETITRRGEKKPQDSYDTMSKTQDM